MQTNQLTNTIQSTAIVFAMIGVLALLGLAFFGTAGLFWMSLVGVMTIFFSRRASVEQVLRMNGAVALQRHQAPRMFAIVDQLAYRAGLQKVPKIYYVRSNTMNAFAMGSRDDAAIGVTAGLLRNMSEREMTGILAHEVSHIQHNDLAFMTVAGTVSRLTRSLSNIGTILLFFNLPLMLFGMSPFSWTAVLLMIFAPTINTLLQLALTRSREYQADAGAVRLTDDPYGLAMALQRLERQNVTWLDRVFGRNTTQNLVPSAFRTHPLTHDRIKRLGAMHKTATPAW